MKKLVTICCVGIVIVTAGVVFADSFLPLHVGQSYSYIRSESSGDAWAVVRYFNEQMAADSFDYLSLQTWNYNNDGATTDTGYFRFTEDALYSYEPEGGNSLQFLAASVGTKWILEEEGQGYDYKVIEIVEVGPLTVPFGTFDKAYKHRRYRCVNPTDLGEGKSPDWYEWFVPGMCVVKEEDYWADNPPVTMELIHISPASIVQLEDLIQKVNELSTDSVNKNSLLVKLESAFQKLHDGNENNDTAAVNSLRAFINVVQAQSGNKITKEDADALIAAAQQIIDSLGDAISDHVFLIEIETEYDYNDPDLLPDSMTYDFDLDVFTDITVSSVEFLTPAGNTYQIPRIPEQCIDYVCTSYEYEAEVEYIMKWEYYGRFPSPTAWADYGDGLYTITVHYIDGTQDQTTAWFGMSDSSDPIPQPTEQPILTSHSNHDTVLSPVTFTWQLCTDVNATNIEIGLDNSDTGENVEAILPTTDTSWNDVVMSPGQWNMALHFANYQDVSDNGDGIRISCAKHSTTSYGLTVTDD